MLGDVRWHAEHEVEHAGWKSGVDEALHQFHATAGSLLRRLDDDRATGRQRGADLARGRERGEVPWREGSDDADRLLHHELARSLDAARHDTSVGTTAF